MQCTLIILIILFICALGAPAAAQMGSAEAPGEGLLKGAAAPSEHHSPAVNSSYNSSVIHLQLFTQSNNSDSPARVIAGNGYYSSNPLALYSPLSRRTQVLNKGSSAASLHHFIPSAQAISGSSEYTVSERSYRGEDSTRTASTSIGMQIDETVTEGKMRIGVFQVDLSSEDETGQIAGGANVDDYHWTETLMKTLGDLGCGCNPRHFFDAISLHYYTMPSTFEDKLSATDFDEDTYLAELNKRIAAEGTFETRS